MLHKLLSTGIEWGKLTYNKLFNIINTWDKHNWIIFVISCFGLLGFYYEAYEIVIASICTLGALMGAEIFAEIWVNVDNSTTNIFTNIVITKEQKEQTETIKDSRNIIYERGIPEEYLK